MRLLALDQSSHTTGYAIFEDDKPVKISHFTYDDIDLGDRLEKIRKKIKSIIKLIGQATSESKNLGEYIEFNSDSIKFNYTTSKCIRIKL